MIKSNIIATLILTCWIGLVPDAQGAEKLKLRPDSNIVLIGNGLASRMLQHGFFETELFRRHAKHRLIIRNMADEGNTPGFRPHSGRPSPWAFPGAEKYYSPLSDAKDRWGSGHTGHGTYDSPDAWLRDSRPMSSLPFLDTMNLSRVPMGYRPSKMNCVISSSTPNHNPTMACKRQS